MNPAGYQMPPPSGAPAPQIKRYDGTNGQPNYDTDHGGHYGASSTIATQGHAPDPALFTGTYSNVSQGLSGPYRDILNTYWQNQITKLETEDHDYKLHQLPLARIKKVMKADPDVKMISAEAPILFAKGCDIFITELTMRAWIHAEENKRRTLQRSDIASALAKSDMFDFLIDIVPREDATPQHKRRPEFTPSGTYNVPDSQIATAGPAGMQQGAPQQDQPHQMAPTDFGGIQHQMPHETQYHQQTGMYPPPAPQAAYQQQQQPQMFDPNSMYAGGYAMQQQAMYPPGQRMQPMGGDPSYRQQPQHEGVGDDDTEGDREYEVI